MNEYGVLKHFWITLFVFFLVNTLTIAQTNTFPENGSAGVGTTSPRGLLHVAGDFVTSASGGTVRKYSTSVSSTQNGPFKIGEYVHGGNYQNLLITGKIYGQSGGSYGEIDFSLMSRSHELPSKDITYQQNQIHGGRLLDLVVYQNDSTGRVVVGFTSNSQLQSFGWDITIIERGNYGFWDNENSFVPLDLSGLNEVSQGSNHLVLSPGGNIGIGTFLPTALLAVNGDIKAKEIIVTEQEADWPDYVFDQNYALPNLYELENFIKEHRHLPGIPSKEVIGEFGQNVGEIQIQLLKKLEELTLINIRQQREIDTMKLHLNELQKELEHERSR